MDTEPRLTPEDIAASLSDQIDSYRADNEFGLDHERLILDAIGIIEAQRDRPERDPDDTTHEFVMTFYGCGYPDAERAMNELADTAAEAADEFEITWRNR